MDLENFMFHQGNGVSNNSAMNLESLDSYFMFLQRNEVSSNNSAVNLENLDNLFHQANGVSNNVDPRIPVVPERSYMQRPYHQGYQSSNCLESISPVFTQEAPVMMQRSNLPLTTEMQMSQMPFDMNLLPEQSVHQQLDFILPQVQRNQTQSANRQEQVNNHGVVLHRQGMQSFSPNTSEMLGNQSGNEWHPSLGLLKLFPSKQISQIPDPIPAYRIQENQAQSADWAETIGLYSNILQDTPKRNVQPNDCDSSMQGSAKLGINECLPQNANSYLNYGRDLPTGNLQLQVDMRVAKNAPRGSPADGELYRGAYPTGMLQAANGSYFQTGNNWEQQQSATSVQQQQERAFLGINQTGSTLEKKSSDGFHISSQALYNLASPSHVEYDAASSTTNCLKNPPVTPEKYSQLRFSQPSATEHSFVIERCSPEKDKQDSVPQIREGGEIYSNQPSTGVIASPSNSTSLKEKVPEDGTSGGIDLSATPQQKTPKRKKHRPKVIKEGKTKKTPKPVASKTEVSTDRPTGKRKYVRRKDLGVSTPLDNEKGEFEASTSRSETRSCRRELNFDSEQKEQVEPPEINKNIYIHGSHLNSNSQEATPATGLDSVSVVPTAKKGQQNTDGAGKLQSKNSWSLIAAANQRIANETPRLERKAHLSTSMDRVNPRNIKTQNGIPYQSNEYEHMQENRVYLEAKQTAIQENLARAMYQAEMQQLSQSRTDHISGCQVIKDKTGQKRDYINISEQASFQCSNGHDNTGRISEICNLGAYKRMKHDEFHRAPCSLPSLTVAAQNGQWQVQSSSTVSCSTETEVYGNRNNRENVVMGNQFHNAMAVGNNYQKSRSLVAEIMLRNRMMREAFQQKTETHGSNLLTGATYRNMESLPQRVPATFVGNTATISRSDADMNSQIVKVKSTIPEVSSKKVLPRQYMETANLHSSRKARGQKEVKIHANTIDEIIRRLEALGISDQQQGAIVPYEGHGTLVPFEEFVLIRRRKPRPRVNLDSETITQWNLLMGKTGNEGEETGLDKEKWWESEREVFRGRVDTFIARMHLVQGDRRFSRWKGSVVDSVIGVFLTQNVSDHLSSSAFMHLAARFPLGSATTEMTSCHARTSAWIEEPEVQIIDPDGTVAFPLGKLTQPLHKQDSTASSQYFEQFSDNLITAIGNNLAEDNNGITKDVVSSQNSSDSIILQASEDMRNSSDSEVEYQTVFPSSNNQNQNIKKEIIDTFRQNQNHTRSDLPSYQQIANLSCLESNPKLNIRKNVGAGSIDLNALSSEESSDPSTSLTTLNLISNSRVTESFFSDSTGNQFHPSEAEATKSQGVFPVRVDAESVPVGLSGSTSEEIGIPKYEGTSTDRYSTASHNVNSQLVFDFESFQPSTSINQTQSLKSFQFETSTAVDAQRPDEAHSKQQTGNLFHTGEKFGSAGSKISNERRKKNDVNKMREVDWDELRKEVLRLGTKKERDKDKMDSMDYEALCNADVDRISDAIRERGMNNMLAERIKAFLNRLVKDHGSIDLEWLRDVPPDKAKDYLLSIRGLGLKSVECIRLLSLHSMAFPVDTNVGRIAVRLGWVPLQPLPESLQLHLLEMYPILESIQKYIWPRLCKLDQRTLYELHYQMITFGKVFCTKSRPNCNVCPMKGECRHFASAFASARLALPGPEEKGMVNFSNNPVAPTEDHRTIMEPLLLASSGSCLGRGLLHFSSKCEPIVEEPSTPEICTEETESDIEDLLSEDPNEIPVIKFSLEALKANVQNIIQEQNLEISEGDLSKALVALNPANASIPAPKLKNVSRLRTEHQVYELPDWHPIIKEMDGREPDDPSPYLLAIWTPGETADSTQPNENKCALSGSGRLCDEKTCFQCNSVREADSQMVRGTILIPCRTAMRGSFPLNGTYFQVNEVFADHESSLNPIAVPRESLWHLRRRTAYFGTSVTTIFRGMPIEEIQYCFWRGFVCVRGFDRKFRAPRPLMARLHFAASRLAKNKKEGK